MSLLYAMSRGLLALHERVLGLRNDAQTRLDSLMMSRPLLDPESW